MVVFAPAFATAPDVVTVYSSLPKHIFSEFFQHVKNYLGVPG